MAKKKKKVTKRRTGDMASGPMRLGKLTLQSKLTIGGIQYLEDVYDESLEELTEHIASGRMRDMVNLLTALAVSSYPDRPVEDLRAELETVELSEISPLLNKLKNVFKVDAGKSPRRVAKKKKVTGNLAE